MFKAGFDDFAGEALSNFDSIGEAATFGNESRNIWAGTEVTTSLQFLHANANICSRSLCYGEGTTIGFAHFQSGNFAATPE